MKGITQNELMTLLPLLPLFHRFNREYFDGLLTNDADPIVSVRWSDGRLRNTAGLYRRGFSRTRQKICEIVLSAPVLENLPTSAVSSTLCHEMIHAWVDLVIGVKESHGSNFRARMALINASQNHFQVSVRHNYPVPVKSPKWFGRCPLCGISFTYKRIVRGAACKKCCDTHYGGVWNQSCVLLFEPIPKEY